MLIKYVPMYNILYRTTIKTPTRLQSNEGYHRSGRHYIYIPRR